ncbi:MAG: DNA polymerase/3'-5' exonuclease PolX [Candidatus Thorarchaeota archaeon]
MKNTDVAKIFREIADLLEILEDSFKPQAYRRAARTIEQLPEPLSDIAARGELEQIKGVGKALGKKIQELLDTGDIEYLHRLRTEVDPGLIELLKIPDVGPKTVRALHRELGITTVDDLRTALEEHKVQNLSGFGPRSEEKLRSNLEIFKTQSKRIFISSALPIAEALVADLKQLPEVLQIKIAGSLRRWRETIGDIDILVSASNPLLVMQRFIEHPTVERVLVQGPTKSSVVVQKGIQVDLRVVDTESFGAALQYFTGSTAHNIALRSLARHQKWKLSEYCLLDTQTDRVIAGETEEAIYKALNMDWVPPELRENTGEIEAAQAHKLPRLLELTDIKGDLHVHSTWSDGTDTIENIAKTAMNHKYKYLAICDHSNNKTLSNGLDEERLQEQILYIRELNKTLDNLHLLAGIEVEILPDGSLDLSDKILTETDIVVAGMHLETKPKTSITDLLVNACKHELVDILAHPTGHVFNQLSGFSIDFETLLDVAKRHGTILEISSFHQFDLTSELSRQAISKGIKFAVNTDAHSATGLAIIQYGVGFARRRWLESKDVINTYSLSQLRKILKHVH